MKVYYKTYFGLLLIAAPFTKYLSLGQWTFIFLGLVLVSLAVQDFYDKQ